MKVFFRRIHLILGLAAGLAIMVSCFTGAVLVFEEELQHLFHKGRYYTESKGIRLPAEQLIANVRATIPTHATIGSVRIYSEPSRNVEIAYNTEPKKKEGKDTKKEGKGQKGKGGEAAGGKRKEVPGRGAEHNWRAFVDPYTGQIVEHYRYKDSFFYTMFALHRWLLGGEMGKLITGISTSIFLFILITGIVLWWPKNKAILKQRLRLKTDAGWKRINHDLHIVLGFYSAIILFVFAFTALAWSFEWFNEGIFKITNSPMDPPKPPKSTVVPTGQLAMLETIAENARQLSPGAKYYNLSIPKDSSAAVAVQLLPAGAANESRTDHYFFDQYSGKLLKRVRFSDRNLGQRVRATFKPVHVGSIWGMPSKIVSFIVCVLGVTFPITGVVMWWNRTKKKKSKKGMSGYSNRKVEDKTTVLT